MLSSSMVPSCLVGRFDSHLCKNPRRTGLLYESFACCSTPQNGDSSWQTHWTIQYGHNGGTATQGFASKYLGQKCTSRIRSHSSSHWLAGSTEGQDAIEACHCSTGRVCERGTEGADGR